MAPPAFYFSIDSTRRFRTQSTDANGVTTEYGYDSATAHLLRTTAANGTQQEYRYYAGSDRTAFTYIGGTASIDYVYNRGQLTDLIRKAYLGTTGYWQHYLLGYDTFGNMTRVQVCASSAERAGYTAPITLATYEYEGNVYNGRLAKMTYGNGDSVSYTYDAFDRQRTAAYNDVDRTTHEQKNVATYHYDYSSDNALTRQYATDSSGITEQYSYQYDSLGRLIHSRQSTGTGALIQSTQHMYDAANRMTSQTWQFGTGLYHQQYSYTGVKADGATDGSVDGTISAITTTIPGQSVITSTYGYNDLRQLTSKGVTVPDQNGTQTKVYDRAYTYDRIAVDSGNWMGTRLASTGYTFGSNSRSFTYTYDDSGNITKIVTAGTKVPAAAKSKEYTYDAQGQLVSEKNSSKTTFLYAYDTAGNIRSITKDGTVTKSFGYTNASWPDLLTSVTSGSTTREIQYEGQTRSDDGVVSGDPTSGNPITYYNGKEYTFTWTKGRQLAKAVVDGKTVEYTYDMSGVRTSKTVNGTTYNYTTLSGKVMRKAFLWYGMLGALFSFAAFMFCQVMNGWHPGIEMFGVGNDLDPIYVRATTMALAAIVFTQIGEVWNCRTETASVFSVGLFSNKQINKGILFEIALIIFITLFPPLQSVFHTSPLVLNDFVFLVLLPPVILLLEEARKAIVRKRNHIDRNGVAIKQAPEKR